MAVPTPLTQNREPDLGPLVSAGTALAGVLQEGQLVVLESTTYPGTTSERLAPMLEESGLAAGRDFNLAFSPERIDPGRTDFTLRNTPKVVGGLTPECCRRAVAFYELVCDEVVEVSSTEAAELTKLLENVFRSVNIALVNELAMLCDRMNIDIWEVVEAAATKPYGFMSFKPGPGHGRALPAGRPLLPGLARARVRHPHRVHRAGRRGQPGHALLLCREDRPRPQRPRAVGEGLARSHHRRLLQAGSGGPARVAGAEDHAHPGRARGRPRLPRRARARAAGLRAALAVPRRRRSKGADAAAILTAHPGLDVEKIVATAPVVVDFRGVTRGIEAPNLVRL